MNTFPLVMTLNVYDTMSRALVPFEPLEPGRVRVYGCGPTIYARAHIGNFRTFLFYDLLHRVLEWKGFDVRFVLNFTDVDDRTIAAAGEEGVTIAEFTEPFAEAMMADSDALGIRRFDAYPRATQYIGPMVRFVETLVERGLAYPTEDGSVYFSIAKFPRYGNLSGMDIDAVRSGARVAMDEYVKEDARDFALWKAAKPIDIEAGAAWDSPWGKGRPGWHLECSVMSIAELGETLDIHIGGEDLIFPHHEDEIAQSEGATGKPFARYWLHAKHLLVEGRKMSKSLGNVHTVRELLSDGVDPAALRHALLSAHYRTELNFTREGLAGSASAVQRLIDFRDRLRGLDTGGAASQEDPLAATVSKAVAAFGAALDDDLNTPEALAALFGMVRAVHAEIDREAAITDDARANALDALLSMDQVLGLLELADSSRSRDAGEEAWIAERIESREQARRDRDFARADALRDELAEAGIVLEDTAQGTRWKSVR